MEQKTSIQKGNIQETLLLPLWGRAVETKKDNPRLIDEKAVEIIKKLDYDFTAITEDMNPMSQHGWVARSLKIDEKASKFIQKHPRGTIVNIGCGLDTTFTRIDNGKINFYELDLPDVIELRKQFFPEGERYKNIASSFLDIKWFDEIIVNDGLLCIAGGVLYYFGEEQIKRFFISMADHFKRSELIFDSLSPMGMKIGKKQVLKKGGMGMSMDDGWELKPIKTIEKWDDRIKVIDSMPLLKGMKKGIPLATRLTMTLVDILGISSMVHVRMEG